jgi:polyphosphate glucokinase
MPARRSPGAKMLFLGLNLGTGLGTAMIVEGFVAPMELGHLPYKEGTYEDYVGCAGLEKYGEEEWRRHVTDVLRRLIAALQPDYTVIGGGNVVRLEALPRRCRQGENANAFRGGFRLWAKDNVVPPDLPPVARTHGAVGPESVPQTSLRPPGWGS